MPDTVTTIERSAFSGCINLETINIPEQVTKIDQIAFQNCGLIEISLPTSLKSIGDSAFRNCDSLVSVTVPDSVTSLGTYVFYDCDALTEVRLGTGITKIQESVFEHCDSLESIVLPYRVVSIGNNAFKDCVKLMSVTIPRATTTISDTAFSYYNRLTIYGVAGTYAETYANAKGIRFVDRQVNAITVSFTDADITLNKGASVTLAFHVEPADFTDEVSWRSSDTSVVTVADDGTVKAVNVGTATVKLTVGAKSASCKITVVQPVTSISLNKTSLTMEALDTFRLVATVYPSNAYNREVVWTTSDESVAMVDEVGVVTAQAKGTATITCASADGSNVTRSCTVTVTNTAHIAATVSEMESPHDYEVNSSDFWQYSVEGAESLQICFAPETNVEDGFDYLYVYDGDGILVGKYTGTELAGQTISVPGDTVRIQLVSDSAGTEWGFRVDSIVPVGSGEPMSEFSYTIEDGKATITGYTGEETELVIPNTISGYPVTKIGDGAFIENSSLISVTFPESVTDIGRYAFGYCTNLMSVTIPDSVTVIKRGAFRNCTSLTTIIIPENVTSMEGDVFFWCTWLTTVYYNATDVLGEWGNDEPVFGHAGENTSSGMSVLFGETVRRIPKGLFCFIDDVAPTPEIEDDIPDSILAAVGTQTNREGSRTTLDGDDLASRIIPIRVREVSIPTSVTEIGGFAFYSCTDLKEVYYGGTQTQWSNISIDEYNEPLINAKIHFAVSEQSPAFKSQSLVLSGQIGLNFFLELPEIPGVDYKKSYMTFTIGGSTAEYRDDFDPNHMNSAGTRYGFTCYVNSIQMADTITAVFHYGNGKTVSKEYSVAQYIDFFEKNIGSFNAKTIELIHAIADFGHYEQIYLADVNGWSIGESYAEMAKHYTETYDYSSILSSVTSKAFVKTLGSSNVEKATYKLHLDSETTVDVYLTPKSGTTLTASATFNGKTYTAVKQADGRYLVRIPNISAHQLGDMITVSGTAGSAFTVQVSALSYTRSILNNASSNKAAKDGLSALYAYYTAVLAYRS